MATLKTYTVTCPDEDCAEEFTIERDPETLGDDGELIECPACFNEWEWEHDKAGVITLLPDWDEDEDENDGLPDDEDDDGLPDEDDDDEEEA